MSYSTKEIWIPCDTLATVNITANTEEGITGAAISPITAGGGTSLTRGLLCGVTATISAADSNNDGIKGFDVRVYSDASKTQLLYSVLFDFDTANVGSAVHGSDVLATPIPFFATPHFTVRTGASAAGTLDSTVTFLVKSMA